MKVFVTALHIVRQGRAPTAGGQQDGLIRVFLPGAHNFAFQGWLVFTGLRAGKLSIGCLTDWILLHTLTQHNQVPPMRRILAQVSPVLFAAILLAYTPRNQPPLQDATDKLEQKIFAERDRLIAQEKQRMLSPDNDRVDTDFWKKMDELVVEYDQHVFLPRLQTLTQGKNYNEAILLTLGSVLT
jgi:hypothetical protein